MSAPQLVACVYRHFDKNDVLLYVGVTANILNRTACHSSATQWFKDISRIDIKHFEKESDAHAAERKAIRTENPKHNIQHTANSAYVGFSRIGISFVKETGKWSARFTQHGKSYLVGDAFETPKAAHDALLEAKEENRVRHYASLGRVAP